MVLVIFVSSAVGCTGPEGHSLDGDILVIGDSFLDYHTPDADIASIAGESLGLDVDMLAFGGATMLSEYSIADTYVDEGHTLLIVSGGGNDLEGCVCGESCEGVIDHRLEQISMCAFPVSNDRRPDPNSMSLELPEYVVHYLLHGPPGYFVTALRAMGDSNPGPK